MSFKDEFAKTPPGPKREELVFQAAIKMGPPKTVPVTVPGPNSTKITYQVMPNFLMIDGIYVPMNAKTAQRIADHFKMHLPTAKMTQQIYDVAKNNKTNITAKPLSGTGATIGGKHYTGKDIVEQGVDKSEFSVAYSDVINKDPRITNQDPNNPQLVDGHMKTILQPIKGKLALHGLYGPDGKPIQGGSGETPHGLDHSEYAAGARFVSDEVEVTLPDGKVIKTTMDKLMNQPNLSKTVSSQPGIQRYTGKVAGPPKGYRAAKIPEDKKEEAYSKSKLLLSEPLWTEKTIDIGGRTYLAKLEPHSNAAKGVSLYETTSKPSESVTKPSQFSGKPEAEITDLELKQTPATGRMSLLQRLTKFLESIT